MCAATSTMFCKHWTILNQLMEFLPVNLVDVTFVRSTWKDFGASLYVHPSRLNLLMWVKSFMIILIPRIQDIPLWHRKSILLSRPVQPAHFTTPAKDYRLWVRWAQWAVLLVFSTSRATMLLITRINTWMWCSLMTKIRVCTLEMIQRRKNMKNFLLAISREIHFMGFKWHKIVHAILVNRLVIIPRGLNILTQIRFKASMFPC